MELLEGLLTGLALVVLVGPVLFVLLRTTVARGKVHGFAVAFGIFVSDVVAVILCAFGVADLFTSPTMRPWLAGIGGIIVFLLGLRYLIRPNLSAPQNSKETDPHSGLFLSFVKGFSINFFNPFVFVVWIGVIGAATTRHGTGQPLAVYLAGALLGIGMTDSVKVVFADKLAGLLRPRILARVFRVFGGVMLVFALRLFYEALKEQ